MIAELNEKQRELYDTDYNLWILESVKKLQNRDLDSLDWEHLIEEILDLSKREKRKIESLLTRLFEHLLKLKYWSSERERNKGHWEREITNFRLQIIGLLEDSPSLKSYLQTRFMKSYQDGRKLASKSSQLTLNTFPENPIATIEQVLDENWLP